MERPNTIYTQVASTLLLNQTGNQTGDPNVYEYTPSPPVEFQVGDILGMYQNNDSSVVVKKPQIIGTRLQTPWVLSKPSYLVLAAMCMATHALVSV